MSTVARTPGPYSRVAGITLLALAYYALGNFSFSFAVTTHAVTPVIFFAEGVSLAALIIWGRGLAPGIFIGQFLLAWGRDVPFVPCLAFGAINTCEALLGAWLFERWAISRNLVSRRDIGLFLLLIVAVLQSFSATLGTLSLAATGNLAWSDLPFNWFCWWLGNSLGQLVMAPLMLTWRRPFPAAGWFWMGLLALITAQSFGGKHDHAGLVGITMDTAFFLAYLGIANRYGTVGAARSAFLITIIGLAVARQRQGHFASADAFQAMIHLSTQLTIQLTATLLVGGMVEELRSSLERLKLAFAAAGDGIWDWDIANGHVYYSPSWERMFGFDVGSVAQTLETVKRQAHPDDLEGMFREVNRYLSREIPSYSHEFRMLHRDGHVLWTLHRAAAIFDDAGKAIRLIGTTTDITARKKAELDSISRLRREASVGRIAAAVAHEVNNPLATVKFWMRMFRQKLAGDPELMDGVNLVEAQIDRIAGAARSLLGFARHRSSTQDRFIATAEILQNIVQLYQGSFEAKGIAIALHCEDHLPVIKGQVEDLQEVLVNLLENAKEILTKNQGVTIRACERDSILVITVSDNGPGLGPRPEVVFDQFYSTRPGGTGIGLTYSQALCRRYGGELVGRNREEGGAEFLVTLPIDGDGNVSLEERE